MASRIVRGASGSRRAILLASFPIIYIEERFMPRLRERAVVLNWSRRKRWRTSLGSLAFSHFGPYREFNPLVVVFRPFGRTRLFQFWQPFRDFKHGRPEALLALEREMFASLDERSR